MSKKLPSNFDAQRYQAAYPDVALSGLDPASHYLRFGSLLNRSPSGKDEGPRVAAPKPVPADAREERKDAERPVKSAKPSPIIERPANLDPVTVPPTPAPPKGLTDREGNVSLETLALGPFESQDREQLCAPLADYARLMGLAAMEGIASAANFETGWFRIGETRIENAWHVGDSRMRLMIAGAAEGSTGLDGWTLRAYQALPSSPADLKEAGSGVRFSGSGPVFHEFNLLHPLMPILLELSDHEDRARAFALLPFPSLLPGGIHGAELKALQSQPNPMDAFWALSEILLRENFGDHDGPGRSISNVRSSGYPVQYFQEWLAAVFGHGEAEADPEDKGLSLVLPADCVPTISALVSRRLDLGEASSAIPPFLISEFPELRPRWSVSLPARTEEDSNLPSLHNPGGSAAISVTSVPIHAAIALRPGAAIEKKMGMAPSRLVAPRSSLTVVLDASEASRTERLAKALRDGLADGEIEFLVRADEPDGKLAQAMDRVCGEGGWTATRETDLAILARGSSYERMLTVSDRVNLAEGEILSTLLGLLELNEDAASAACVLLGEARVRKQAILRTATGGLFPASVSFASSPRLSFFEPDVLQALPNVTYPVVANTLLCTAWRTRALAELKPASGPVSRTAQDIRIGLDLMAAGYRNLCTTLVKASLEGSYARRDAIDPVGSLYLRPAQWEDILGRVTVLRELF